MLALKQGVLITSWEGIANHGGNPKRASAKGPAYQWNWHHPDSPHRIATAGALQAYDRPLQLRGKVRFSRTFEKLKEDRE
jgi:hypothetical protein